MKRLLGVILTVVIALMAFSSCGKEDSSVVATEYTGILSKVKLGMSLSKIQMLQETTAKLYWEDELTLWNVNSDTELYNEVLALIPTDNQHFFADDSLITYNFKTVPGETEKYLKGYSQEVHCLLDRATAEKYFADKTALLASEHCKDEAAVSTGTILGTEDIDLDLVYKEVVSAPSYDLIFSMTLTYDDVLEVEDYYASKFEIEIVEKETVVPIPN